MKTWTERVIAIHPAIVTGLFVLLFVGGGAAINVFPFASRQSMMVFPVVMVIMMTPLVAWHYSLRDVATQMAGTRWIARQRTPILFIALVVSFPLLLVFQTVVFTGLISVADAMYRPVLIAMPVVMLAAVFSYFGAIWTAADALMRFEQQSDPVPFHKTIGTFILELYLPIGIWFLYPRVQKLLASEESTAPAQSV